MRGDGFFIFDGKTHDIGITVTTDASDILLETDPFLKQILFGS